jgi:transposase-like protein
MQCPKCPSQSFVKNGFNATNKQMYRCKECGRQFVLNPDKSMISDEKKFLIDRLLLERVSLAAITRIIGVSKFWLQRYVNKKYESIPRYVEVSKKRRGQLTIECDEM